MNTPTFPRLMADFIEKQWSKPFPEQAMEALEGDLKASHEAWVLWCQTASAEDFRINLEYIRDGRHPLAKWIFEPVFERLFSVPGFYSQLERSLQYRLLYHFPHVPDSYKAALDHTPGLLEIDLPHSRGLLETTSWSDDPTHNRELLEKDLSYSYPTSLQLPAAMAWMVRSSEILSDFIKRRMSAALDPLPSMGVVLNRLRIPYNHPPTPEELGNRNGWLSGLVSKGWRVDPARLEEPHLLYLQDMLRQALLRAAGPEALIQTRLLDEAGFLSLTALQRKDPHPRHASDNRFMELQHSTVEMVFHEIEQHGATLEETCVPLLRFAAWESPEVSPSVLERATALGLDFGTLGLRHVLEAFGPWLPFLINGRTDSIQDQADHFSRLAGLLFEDGKIPPCPEEDKTRCGQLLEGLDRSEHLDFLEPLMKSGFDLAIFDKPGVDRYNTKVDLSPLHRILQAGRKKVGPVLSAFIKAQVTYQPARVQALLDIRGLHGATAFHLAARNRDITALDALLKAGADPKARDDAGNTLAHWLMRKFSARHEKDFVPVLRWIENHGVDLLAPNKKGQTPMAKLVLQGTADSLLALVQQAGNQTLQDTTRQGVTAMEVITNRKDMDAVLPLIEQVVLENSLPEVETPPTPEPRRRL